MVKKTRCVISPAALLTNVYIVLMITVFLLWTGPEGYGAIQETKNVMFRWLTAAYLILLLLLGLELLLIEKDGGKRLLTGIQSTTWTQRLVFLYAILTILSTWLSDFRQQAILGMSRGEGMVTILLYCGTFLAISSFGRPGKWMGWVLAMSMTAMNVICLLQLAGQNPMGLYPAGTDYYDADILYAGAYLGTIGNAGLTAAILCMTTPLFLGMVWKERGWSRWLALVPVLLNITVLLLAQIQAGILGVVLGLLLAVPVAVGPGKKQRISWIAVGGILLAGFVTAYFWPGKSGSLYELGQILRGNFDPGFGNGRIHIWKEVLQVVPEHLWFGTGPDTMAAYSLQPLSIHYEGAGMTLNLMVDVAHNEYLNILFHQGVLALMAYLAALGISFVKWLKTDQPYPVILGTGVLCYGIQAFFSIGMCIAVGLFWILWALLECSWKKTEATK